MGGWGGPEKSSDFPQVTQQRQSEARTLDSLFLKWQSFLNISAFQTFFQSSFLPTIYSVIQLFANLLNPKKSHIEPIKYWSSSHSAHGAPLGQAVLCTLSAWSWLGPFNLSPPPTTQSVETTIISPPSEQLLLSEMTSSGDSLCGLHPLSHQLHKERTLPSCSLLCPLYLA